MHEVTERQPLPPHKVRKRIKRLRHMLHRIRGVRAQKERENADPIVLHTMTAEIKALEWVLADVLGEDLPP